MRNRFSYSDNGPKKPFPTKLVVLLFVNTVLLFGIYCFFVMRRNINWLFWVYYGLTAATSLGYLIYNRGLSRDKLTTDMLPADWSYEKKTAFLEERDERKRKSKWLLTIIFPLCLTIFFDILYLFWGDYFSSIFGSLGDLFKK